MTTEEYVYQELVCRYRAARVAWAENPQVQEAAALLGIDERGYCDRYLATMPPITFTSTTTSVITWAPLYARAFREAQP